MLESKFRSPGLRQALLRTGGPCRWCCWCDSGLGNAFLLEHNARKGRDRYWSDDQDGSSFNALGLQLMLLRARLAGRGLVALVRRPLPASNCQEIVYGPLGWPNMWTCGVVGPCPATCSGTWR